MRAWLLLLAGLTSCAEAPGPIDAGVLADAAPDAALVDSGLFPTPCGMTECGMTEFCLVEPVGPCTPRDGGTCQASEEQCLAGGSTPGCAAPRTRRCMPHPAGCAPSCPCLINTNPCPSSVLAGCRRGAGEGFTVECPFP